MSEVELSAEEIAPQLLDFDEAELVPAEPPSSGVALRVSGTAPCLNMAVRLVPVRYVMQPDYWAVHVIGELRGDFCLEAIRPFHEVLFPAPLGKQGVVVVGETKRQRLENP